MNQTIQERQLSMLSNADLSHVFWVEAVKIAQAWSCKQPSYDHLCVFGCEAFVHVPKENHLKLNPKTRKCIFLGYGDSREMGYRLWDLEAIKMQPQCCL